MKELGRWVTEEGLVNEAQLAAARKLQGEMGVPLPMALIELKLVEEKALVDLVAKKSGLPKAPRRIHRMEVSAKALALVPQDYCWQYSFFPFGIDVPGRRLRLAIVDPDDQEAVSTARRLARLEPSLFVAGPKQIERAIRRHYLDSFVDETNSPPQLRYFGYENITAPGASSRPTADAHCSVDVALDENAAPPDTDSGELAWEPPKNEPDESAGAGSLSLDAPAESGGEPGPIEFPLPPPTRRTPPQGIPATAGATPLPPLEPADTTLAAEDNLPVVKDSAVVGRLQRGESLAELSQRLDTLEHLLSRVVALLAHDARDTAGQLARLSDEIQGLRRRRNSGG